MLTFQELILKLQSYWGGKGCALLQPYDMEMGAGTFHTATFLRAIETGRYALLAANTGVTAIIDPHGTIAARLPQFAEGILEGDVRGYVGASPYVKIGNTPIVLTCIALLAALVFIRRRVGRAEESR